MSSDGAWSKVSLHRAVIVEMVAREVGEYPGREGQSVQSPLVQAVGGRFHGDMGHSPLAHGASVACRSIGPGVVNEPAVDATG